VGRLLVAAALIAVAASGCGSNHERVRPISARLSISTGDIWRVRAHHTLRCNPVGGDMPQRDELCSMIAAHPVAMLDPPPAQSGCDHVSPWVRVSGIGRGRRVSLKGTVACDWPGGEALFAYYLAAEYPHDFPVAAVRLHCDEDPALLRRPIQWARVRACLKALPPHWRRR
jgi:hypothetical protein